MPRKYKTPEQVEQEAREARESMRARYRTDKLIVIYARQSTAVQVVKNRESAEDQAIELLEYALDPLGWPDDMRLLFIENQLADGRVRNASGRLRIDQRPKLQAVTELIERGEVGAVLVRDVSRLFRDEDMIEPALFAKLCKQYHVIVLTREDEFDFNDPRHNDRKRFLDEAQAAADFITKHLGMMKKYRDKKAGRGEYVGGRIATGYMLDDERLHLEPIPEWAAVVNGLYKRFRQLYPDFVALCREVLGKPLFPPLPDEIKERIGLINLLPVENGYYAIRTRSGLTSLLTNPAYLGHVFARGRIVRYNAHPAIVSEDDFFFAYNHLSAVTLEGEPIDNPRRTKRYTHKDSPPRDALMDGVRRNGRPLIESHQGSVNINQQNAPGSKSSDAAYVIKHFIRHGEDGHTEYSFLASIYVNELDTLFSERLRQRLRLVRKAPPVDEGGEPDVDTGGGREQAYLLVLHHRLRKAIEEAGKEIQSSLTGVGNDIKETQRKIARIERRLDVAQDTMSDKDIRENYASLKQLRLRLAALGKKKDDAAKLKQELQGVEQDIVDLQTKWNKMTLDRRRGVIRTVTEAIYLDEIAPGWLRLTIVWGRIFGYTVADVAYLWRTSGKTWTEAEDAIMAAGYLTLGRKELQEQLPTRTWNTIRMRASTKQLGRRHPRQDDSGLPENMSMEDKRVMEQYGLVAEQPEQRLWWRLEDVRSIKLDIPSAQGRGASLSLQAR